MMRARLGLIAYEFPPLVGGMATYARALARHMQGRGYEVHVFSNPRAESFDGLTVHPILTTDLARDIPAMAGFRMDLWHAINFAYIPLACLKRPFVLSSHGTDFLTPWVGWKLERVPLAWRAAGILARRCVRQALAAAPLRCVDRVLMCSRFSAARFRQEYPSVGPMQVIPMGVDDWFFEGPPVARHPRRLLTVGNLDKANRRKNVDGVIRAMALVGQELDLEYAVIGDGCEREALRQLAVELGVGERVHLPGRLSASELREAYAAAGLFVLVPRPEPGDIEGFGIVYLEAAAAGTPGLAGRWGGATDAVTDGRSGFFAADASPEGIAAALRDYYSGRVRLDRRLVRQHAERHRWPHLFREVEAVYEQVMERRTRLTRRRPRAVSAAPEAGSYRTSGTAGGNAHSLAGCAAG